jgi:hypothetical protein
MAWWPRGEQLPIFSNLSFLYHSSESLFGWIGPKTLVQPHEWTAFLLRRVAVHIYHLTTANLLKSRTPIITGVTPIIACLTSETQQNRL